MGCLILLLVIMRTGQVSLSRPGFNSGLAQFGRSLASAGAKRLLSTVAQSVSKRFKGSSGNDAERSRGEPVTSAADVRRDYRARRVRRRSPRVARKARAFNNRVMGVVDKYSSSAKVIFNEGAGLKTALPGQQATLLGGGLVIGSLNGNPGERDLRRIQEALGDTAVSQTNTRIKGCMIQVDIKNASDRNPVFVELYTYVARKPVYVNTALGTLYEDGFNNAPPSLTGGTACSSATYGTTPFVNRLFCENFKILKKETVKLGVGASSSFMMRTRGPKLLNIDSYENVRFSCGRYTKGYLMVMYGDPDTTTGLPVACALSWNSVRTYVVESKRSAGLANSIQVLTP